MAIKWMKIKKPYGFRYFSEETPIVIEDFGNGIVEVWMIPSYPAFTHRRCETVREAKYYANSPR